MNGNKVAEEGPSALELKRMLQSASAQLVYEMDERHKLLHGDHEQPDPRKLHIPALGVAFLLLGPVISYYAADPQSIWRDIASWPSGVLAAGCLLALAVGIPLSGYILARSPTPELIREQVLRTVGVSGAATALLGAGLLLFFRSLGEFDDALAGAVFAGGGFFSYVLFFCFDLAFENIVRIREASHRACDKRLVYTVYRSIYTRPRSRLLTKIIEPLLARLRYRRVSGAS